jgi:hypothetical protein
MRLKDSQHQGLRSFRKSLISNREPARLTAHSVNKLDGRSAPRCGRLGRGARMESIHFISGLPRSGPTLLAALLRQNPSFEAGMSSPKRVPDISEISKFFRKILANFQDQPVMQVNDGFATPNACRTLARIERNEGQGYIILAECKEVFLRSCKQHNRTARRSAPPQASPPRDPRPHRTAPPQCWQRWRSA